MADPTAIPPQDALIADDEGLTSWSASFDRIIVHEATQGNRLLKVVVRDETVFQRLLTKDQAVHLARLLSGSSV